MHEWIQLIVMQYGLYAVFLIVMFESAGLPLPGETALLLASAYSGMTGHLSIAGVILVAALGAVIGDNVGFLIGRRFGLPLLERHGHKIGLKPERLEFGRFMFAKHGAKIVFFGRFVAFLRIFAALLAGVNRYEWRVFMFYNAAGGLCWSILFGVGGFICGNFMQKAAGPIGMIGLGIALGALVFGWRAMRQQEHLYYARTKAELSKAGNIPSSET